MNTCVAASPAEWRTWLAEHGESEHEIWLVIQHKGSGVPSVRYHEAVEQALCFGWIDSLARKHDARSFRLRFTPRRSGSRWSHVNRARAAALIAQGQMTPQGLARAPRPARSHGTSSAKR